LSNLKTQLSDKEAEYTKTIDNLKIVHDKEIRTLKTKNFFTTLLTIIISVLVGAGGGILVYSSVTN
jgi:hypothetical protein